MTNNAPDVIVLRIVDGWRIVLLPNSFKFGVFDETGERHPAAPFSSMEDAENAIQRARRAKATSDKRSLSIKAITTKGVAVTVTGIHGGHGRVTYSPRDADTADTLYPDMPIVRQFLFRIAELRAEMDTLGTLLRKAGVSTRRNSYGSVDPERLSQMLDRLEEDFQKATKAAEDAAAL